jgi:hypothetical protein
VGELERKRPSGRLRPRWEDNIKMDLRHDGVVWAGLIWLRIRTSSLADYRPLILRGLQCVAFYLFNILVAGECIDLKQLEAVRLVCRTICHMLRCCVFGK